MSVALDVTAYKTPAVNRKKPKQKPSGRRRGKPAISRADMQIAAFVRTKREATGLLPWIVAADSKSINRNRWGKYERGDSIIDVEILYVMARTIAITSRMTLNAFFQGDQHLYGDRPIPEKIVRQIALMQKLQGIPKEKLRKILK